MEKEIQTQGQFHATNVVIRKKIRCDKKTANHLVKKKYTIGMVEKGREVQIQSQQSQKQTQKLYLIFNEARQ